VGIRYRFRYRSQHKVSFPTIMAELRLYMFECGSIRLKLHDIKMNQGLNEPYRIPVPWFFIQHPRGNIVIDGGNALECATQPYEHWGSTAEKAYPEMRIEQGCVNELQCLRIEPDSETYVLQSHLHLDHTGAARFFYQSADHRPNRAPPLPEPSHGAKSGLNLWRFLRLKKWPLG
jgi:glyoxylase-like metal-dependent hydrolase (beta-lactamase superfamily II)